MSEDTTRWASNPCVCGSKCLKAKWDSDTDMGWVHCDRCGRASKPVHLSNGRDGIIGQWNSENPLALAQKDTTP